MLPSHFIPPFRLRSKSRRNTDTQVPANAPLCSSPRCPPRILLVDDDRAVLESLRRVFAGEGWHVTAVASGEAALACIQADQPDLIVTDLCMATVSGWDLLFHEHFERPGVPFFVISALPPKSTGGADTFATEFFQKPLDLDALLTAVHRHLGTRRPASPQSDPQPS